MKTPATLIAAALVRAATTALAGDAKGPGRRGSGAGKIADATQ